MASLSARELKQLIDQDSEEFIMPASPRRNKRQRPPKHMRSESANENTESSQSEPVSEKAAVAPQKPAPSAEPAPEPTKPAAVKQAPAAKAPVTESKKMSNTKPSVSATPTKPAKADVIDVEARSVPGAEKPPATATETLTEAIVSIEFPKQSAQHEDGPIAKLVKAIPILSDADGAELTDDKGQEIIKKITDISQSDSMVTKMSKDVDGITVGVMSRVMLEAVGHGGRKAVEDKFQAESVLFEYLQPKSWRQIGKDFVQLLFGVDAAYRGGNQFDTIPHLMDKDRGQNFRGHTLTLLMEFLSGKVAGVVFSDESRQMIATFANGSNVCFTVLDDGKVVIDWSSDYTAKGVFEKNALINGDTVDLDKALPAIDFVVRDRVVENFTVGIGEAILVELSAELTGEEVKASSK